MEDKIALVYMTLNMIILLYYLINSYYISFNNFLLTNRENGFLFFVYYSSCENKFVSFRFRSLPRAHDFVKKFIRIANEP